MNQLEQEIEQKLKTMFAEGKTPQEAVIQLHEEYPANNGVITQVLLDILGTTSKEMEEIQENVKANPPKYAFVDTSSYACKAEFMSAQSLDDIEGYINDMNDPDTNVVVYELKYTMTPKPVEVIRIKIKDVEEEDND